MGSVDDRLFCVRNGVGTFLVAVRDFSERRDEGPAGAWFRAGRSVSRGCIKVHVLDLSLPFPLSVSPPLPPSPSRSR